MPLALYLSPMTAPAPFRLSFRTMPPYRHRTITPKYERDEDEKPLALAMMGAWLLARLAMNGASISSF